MSSEEWCDFAPNQVLRAVKLSLESVSAGRF